jgi:hypothetical protein
MWAQSTLTRLYVFPPFLLFFSLLFCRVIFYLTPGCVQVLPFSMRGYCGVENAAAVVVPVAHAFSCGAGEFNVGFEW